MKKRIIIISLIVALIAIAAVGTNAYFTAQSRETNVITSGSIKIDLLEMSVPDDGSEPVPFEDVTGVMPGASVSKVVTVRNTGNNAAWVRVSVEKAIQLREGVEGDVDLSLVSLDVNREYWTEQDGYYYYNAELKPGAETEPLFTAVTFAAEMGNMYQESTATVSVIAQATQVVNNGGSALEAAGWPAEKEA